MKNLSLDESFVGMICYFQPLETFLELRKFLRKKLFERLIFISNAKF